MMQTNPEFNRRQAAFEQLWQQVHGPGSPARKVVVSGNDTLYEIPVVVHVIHKGGAIGTIYNPSDATIQNAITELNQNFAATFPGHPAAGAGGVNIRIRFAFAQRDSSCNPTTGINRINGVTALGGANGTAYDSNGVNIQSTGGISDATLKGLIWWPNTNYYNIWIVSEIDNWDGYSAGSGVQGYAFLPPAQASLDGLVITASQLAPGATTISHEMGHAFNLRHPFEGGCVTGNCATTGDKICDTDPQAAAVFDCPTGNNPCTGTSWVPVINNIMGYSSCPDRFTQGQSDRVMLALFNMRSSLIQSLGATAPGAQPVQPGPAVTACPGPGVVNTNNAFDVGPRNIIIGDLQSFSQGYTNDGNLSYINRTLSSCQQSAVAPAHFQKGQSYAISVGAGNNPENVRVYIDYNNDGVFTGTGELVFSSDGPSGQSFYTHSGTFTVPNQSYVVENTYVRVRVVSDVAANPQPCTTLQYGQAEDFAAIINEVVLPVRLKSFTAKTVQTQVHLQWEAGEEIAFSHYEVERSNDGSAFTTIGHTTAKGSHTLYYFEDRFPLAATNYYRLKMVDRDGRYAYSPVRTALFPSPASTFAIFPNPASERQITVIAPISGTYSYQVFNTLGQSLVIRRNLNLQHNQPLLIDLRSAVQAPGIYYLQLSSESGSVYKARFVLE
ncbi:M43 family zinc metalloprotease [Taibaiella helva]|uniref:M43 family zinc metalloprotease n=1 Tax=Taibaiella helva TaxID=2301235 RepID=UPI0018E57322|nr:M43 family zinc metalloprotease [Taibaiella helva]